MTSNELPCADKLAFGTKREAEASGAIAEWRHGSALKAYKCKYCDLWHLASS